MKTNCSKFVFILLVGISFQACRKDGPPDTLNPSLEFGDEVVVITNEGNFQFGNADVSIYNPEKNEVVNEVFRNKNNKPLGDVLQSLTFWNETACLVVNNSGKVELCSFPDFESIGSITGLVSPRYLLPVSKSKAYVSDLTSNAISVVDFNSQSVTANIPIKGWSEQMYMSYGNVFITNVRSEFLHIVDISSDSVVDSVAVGYGSNSLIEDRMGHLWVLCSGSLELGKKAILTRINPLNINDISSFEFENLQSLPTRLCINKTGDTLFFIDKHVFYFPINGSSATKLIDGSNANFYALGLNPNNNEMYVGDALDYVQKGLIHRYTTTGKLIASFKAGIIPGNFYFK